MNQSTMGTREDGEKLRGATEANAANREIEAITGSRLAQVKRKTQTCGLYPTSLK